VVDRAPPRAPLSIDKLLGERTMLKYAFIAACVTAPLVAQAAVVKPDTARASSEFSATYRAENTINGTGLTGDGTDVTEAHAPYSNAYEAKVDAFGNHWTTRGSAILDQWIVWAFDTPTLLGGIYIWNHESGGGLASNSGYEPTLFDLELFDANGNSLFRLDDEMLEPDNTFAQAFSFGDHYLVTEARFDVEAVQSSTNYTGLAEVAFDTEVIGGTTVVPVPAALPLLATGLAALGAVRLRRRS
jgi:hypothetical protein